MVNSDDNREYIKDKTKIDIAYIKNDEPILNSTSFYFDDDFKSLGNNLIAYGPLRLNTQASSTENQESKNSENMYNLFHKDGFLKNINYLLKMSQLRRDNQNEFNNLKNAIVRIQIVELRTLNWTTMARYGISSLIMTKKN